MLNALLVGMVFVSAIALVLVRHQSRQSFIEWQVLQQERDRLNVEWGQLQLEESTWARPARIEAVAREQLKMIAPPIEQVIIIKSKP